jgi:hypothetical protein
MKNNIKTKTVLGLSGVARCGKDTMCQAMIETLSNSGYIGKRISIADGIRTSLYDFILKEFKIDIWNATLEEKEVIRGMMIEYGLAKRAQSKGQFLTDVLQKTIDNCSPEVDVLIATDIRYAVYDKDELYWLKTKNNGLLVHISKIIGYDEHSAPLFLKPANIHEEQNDPILQQNSDMKVAWESKGEFGPDSREYYLNKAESTLKYLNII